MPTGKGSPRLIWQHCPTVNAALGARDKSGKGRWNMKLQGGWL